MEVKDRKVGWAGHSAGKNVVMDLCASDDDDAVTVEVISPRVARMPSLWRRKRSLSSGSGVSGQGVKGSPKRQRQNTKGEHSNDEIQVIKTAKSALPLSPLEQILEVFPDVQLDHARQLLKEHANVPANVINALLEAGNSYPKAPAEDKKKMAPLAKWNTSVNEGDKYDFMSTSSFEPSKAYWQESAQRLVYDFPFLTLTGAKFLLGKTNNHYAVAHDKIFRAITGKDDKTYIASLGEDAEETQYLSLRGVMYQKAAPDALQQKRLKNLFDASIRSNFLSKSRKKKKAPEISDPVFKEEVAYVEPRLQQWMKSVELEMSRKATRQVSIQEGTALECGCCFDQYDFDEMIQCRDGHLFCQDCLSNYVESQVFANGNFGTNPQSKEQNLELICFHGDGCKAGFERMFLERSLKSPVLEKYDELQTRVSLTKAGLDKNVCTCPGCGFSAEVSETQNVFACLRCGYESCRHCREASHVPLRCDEVEKQHESNARLKVEEAAAAAVIRTCPTCKKGVIKSDGCNKMTCACGAKWCYLCRTIIKDYTHFCQIPHCDHSNPKKCKYKCALYTKDAEEDARRMREAAMAEAKRVEEEMGANTSQKEKNKGLFTQTEPRQSAKPSASFHVDVDSILKAPTRKAPR